MLRLIQKKSESAPAFLFRILLTSAAAIFIGASSAEDAANRLFLLPVVDGEGVRSRLLVTNVSESSSQCSLDLSGSDLGTARFEDHFLVSGAGASATFELEENGGNLVWTSNGERSLTYGYVSLNCTEPVTAQVLYSSRIADELVSLTGMPGTRKADRFQFTLMPQIGSLVLVFANDLDPDASCELELESPYGSTLSKASISVSAMTSDFEMADELFRIPEDYTAGAVRVICDRELAATGFLLNGGKFSVLPPVVLSMPLISISGGAALTEGGEAVFTVTANAPSGEDMKLSLMVSDSGDHVDASDLGEKQVTLPAGMTSVDYVVATTDDSYDEDDGMVTVVVNPGEGYLVSEIDDFAQVAISDNDEPAPVFEPPVDQPPDTQPPVVQPPDSQPPVNPPRQVEPPSPVLTGVSYAVRPARGRRTLIGWETQPEDASLTGFGVSFDPGGAARVFNADTYYQYLQVHCENGYSGNVEITLWARKGNVELTDTVNFFCE